MSRDDEQSLYEIVDECKFMADVINNVDETSFVTSIASLSHASALRVMEGLVASASHLRRAALGLEHIASRIRQLHQGGGL